MAGARHLRTFAIVLALTACGVKVDGSGNPIMSQVDAGDVFNDNGFVDGAIVVPIDAALPIDAPSLSATDFITQYGNMQCAEAFTCKSDFPGSSNQFQNDWDTTETRCDADALDFFNPTKVEADILSASITYHPADAAACLAGIVFGTCDNFWNTGGTYPLECNTALVGSVAVGGSCATDFECISLFCNDSQKCQAQ